MRRTGLAVTVLLVLTACGGSGGAGVTIDVPDDLISRYQEPAQSGEYIFYALSGDSPTWESLVEAGIFICSVTRPLLIPAQARGVLDSGGFPSGMKLTLDGEVVEGALGISQLIVTIPAAVSGCTDSALETMAETPGMLLMVDAGAPFPGAGQLVKVDFE